MKADTDSSIYLEIKINQLKEALNELLQNIDHQNLKSEIEILELSQLLDDLIVKYMKNH